MTTDHRIAPLYFHPCNALFPGFSPPSPGWCWLWPCPVPGCGRWWCCFPGLLLEAVERGGGRWRPWLLGWLAGTVYWLVATNWVLEVMHHYGGLSLIAAVGSLLGMGLYLGLIWLLITGLSALVPSPWRIWFLPFAWVAIDALRRFQPYQFPWSDVALVFGNLPAMLGSLPVWGASGLGWATVAVGAGLWGLLRPAARPAAAALLIAAVGCTIVFAVLAPAPEPSGPPVRVAVLQPGTSLEEKWDPAEWQEIADRVWTLTRRAADAGAEIVLWPESAVPFRIETDETYRAMVTDLATELEIQIVLNSIGGTADGGHANSAYLVTADGVSEVRYDKVHLVPFGEYVPPWAELAFTDALVREVGRFTPGRAVKPCRRSSPWGLRSAMRLSFRATPQPPLREGAEILVTLTNDGWYGFSWAPAQHFAHVRLRAAEQRRWFARAALTGISAFVDPYGRVHSRLGVGEQGLLVDDLQPDHRSSRRERAGVTGGRCSAP